MRSGVSVRCRLRYTKARQSKGNKSRYVIKVMKVDRGRGYVSQSSQEPKDVPGLFIGALN